MSSMLLRRCIASSSRLRTPIASTVHLTRQSGLHTSRVVLAADSGKHTSDSYSKEVDSTPASDNSVHRIDPNSDKVQKPHEPPSGEFSRAGTQTDEYRHVEGAKEPYSPKDGSSGRYGGQKEWSEEKGPETSGKEDGPDAGSSGGRKPE